MAHRPRRGSATSSTATSRRIDLLREIQVIPGCSAPLGPSGVRGLLLQRGKQGEPTRIPCSYEAHFDWSYPADQPEMAELYRRAKRGQWDGDTDLPWATSVDPLNPEVPLLPRASFATRSSSWRATASASTPPRSAGSAHSVVGLDAQPVPPRRAGRALRGGAGDRGGAVLRRQALRRHPGRWTRAATSRSSTATSTTKLELLYQINDNLFVIIDALIQDSRWDMKFLGMQIMVEGLALGAFGTLYKITGEPLLKQLLKMVIQDEARHVHYGVLALREHFTKHLSDSERREREQWSFEVALLMRNRFMAYEVYEEWFEGRISRATWRRFVSEAPGMREFRHVMFSRLVPNLREIGLLSDRIKVDYDRVGLSQYFGGASADQLTAEKMLSDLDASAGTYAGQAA